MKEYESIDEFLRDIPPHVDELVGYDNLFLIETKQGRRSYIRLSGGDVVLSETESETPVCSIVADEAALLSLIQGKNSPMKLLLTGKVKVKGDVGALMKLIALL